MQEELPEKLKLDASSRKAGALMGEAIVAYAEPLITIGAVSAARRVMKASGWPGTVHSHHTTISELKKNSNMEQTIEPTVSLSLTGKDASRALNLIQEE